MLRIEIEMRQEKSMQNHNGIHEQAVKAHRMFRQLKHNQKSRIKNWLYEAGMESEAGRNNAG